jgi:hypothetical protein
LYPFFKDAVFFGRRVLDTSSSQFFSNLMYHHMLISCPPEKVGECKATVSAVVFSLRVNEFDFRFIGFIR